MGSELAVATSPDEIDVDWLNQAVGRGNPLFERVDVTRIGADSGMYGMLARVRATPVDAAAGTTTFVAKFAATTAATRASLGKGGLYRNEYDFYTRMSHDFPVRVPRCYYAHYDPETYHTLLLLEYVEGEFGDDVRGATHAQATVAIDTAARMHRYWATPGRLDAHTWLKRLAGSDFYHSFAGIDDRWTRDALAAVGDRVPAWFRRHAPRTARILQSQVEILDRLPTTLTHVDFRTANMCFDRAGQGMTLLDWQMPYRFAGIWDIGVLLTYGLTQDDRRAWQEELIGRYCGGDRVPDWAMTAFRHAALFLAFNMVRNVPVFDRSNPTADALMWACIERACAAVEDTDAIELL
jgi:hypothetical protein